VPHESPQVVAVGVAIGPRSPELVGLTGRLDATAQAPNHRGADRRGIHLGEDRIEVTAPHDAPGYDMSQATPREVARIPTVRQADTVAVDPATGRLFVTGTSDGTVEIIDP